MAHTSDYSLIANQPNKKGLRIKQTNPRKNYFGLQFVAFILGLGLLFLLLYEFGFKTIADPITHLGWSFFIIVGFYGIRHFLRAYCIYLAIPENQRNFNYLHCLMARLGGETVSFISFTGPILGEATKAILLKRDSEDLKGSVSAVVADTAIYYVSVLILIFCGSLTLLFYTTNVPKITYTLFFLIFFTLVILVGIIYLKQKEFRLISPLIIWFSKFKWFPKVISNKVKSFEEVEKSFHDLYTNRRQTFFFLCGINFLAHILSVVEVMTALYLLGLENSALKSFIIETMTKVINLIFSFVPGTFGVYEGGNGIILHLLGYTTAAGISLGLVRKGASIFWILIGLIILIWRTLYQSVFNEREKVRL
ncbi:MAG: flippase-like domain-containing protein [Pyrinomonadaceae bacterium]|nr:flippase-like domain-containing protein [Pyrinomonadaceae bacterium]